MQSYGYSVKLTMQFSTDKTYYKVIKKNRKLSLLLFCIIVRDNSFSIYAKFSEKLTFLTP